MLLACSSNDGKIEAKAINRVVEKVANQHYYRKPSAPVEVKHQFASEPALGRPLDIQLLITLAENVQNLAVSFGTEKGLRPTVPAAPITLGRGLAGQTFNHTIRVIPQSSGKTYVNVFVVATENGEQQSTALSIPVIVGAENEKENVRINGDIASDRKGRPTVIMRANETIETGK
jgi:hypothetical protein